MTAIITRRVTRRALIRGLALGVVVGAAQGCALPGAQSLPNLYRLSPKSTFSPDLPRREWQIIIEAPFAAAGLDTARIALMRDAFNLDYFGNAAWTDNAPAMVQTLIIESFENSDRVVSVGRESIGLRADFVLKSELREFQAELDPQGGPPTARVRINAKLVIMPERTIIASDNFEAMKQASRNDMAALVGAFDEALGEVLKQIVEWTIRTAPARRRTANVI